jgi:prolipoprotein diacylglyceryl transferase
MLPYFSLSEINLGPIIIQIWGSFVAIGFILALIISLSEARRKQINEEIIWDMMIIALLGMIAGARIFYVIFSSEKNIFALLDPHSGFSLIGGVIVSGILALIYLKYRKQDIKKIFDVLTLGIIVALIFTRIGCFLVNDHIGKITTLPWGMEFIDGSIRHPVALYYIFFLIIIFLVISKIKIRKRKDGLLFLSFCASYAVFGFIADLSRCDDLNFCDAHFVGLTVTQWILLVFLTFLFIFFIISKIFKKQNTAI